MEIKKIIKQSNLDTTETELLIAHILKKPREFILAHPEQEITKAKKQKIIKNIKERSKGVPIAYLTGHKEFFGLDFLVNKNVLIPRPDTELMVELALQELRIKNQESRIVLIDIGTGSGCIPISILKTLNKFPPRLPAEMVGGGTRGVLAFAIDISSLALTTARKNAKLHKTKIKFLHGDLLEPIIKNFEILKFQNFKIIITANLPYLTPKQFKQEPSIQHEPKLALVAGNDGLKYYRQLLKQISQLSKSYNLKPISYFEIDPSQTSSIKKLIKKILPQAKIEIKKDLTGLDRVVIIKI